MLSKVCVFNNKIFISNSVGHDIFVIGHTYVESTENQPSAKFYETTKIKLPLRDPVLIKDVYLAVTDNFDIGLKCMIIAAIDYTNKWSLFVYFDLPTSNLFRVKYLDWPSKTVLLPNINFFFCHGPTCLILHENQLEFFLLSHKLKYCYNLKSIFPANFTKLKLLQIVGLGKVGPKLLLDVLLIILSCNVAGCQLIQILSLGLNSQKKDSSVTCRKLAISFFFPKCYESVLKTVKVFNIQIPERSSVTNFNEISWTENDAVVCTESECLLFDKGVLKYCCKISLPFPEILHLKAELHSLATENVNLILSSGNQSVYFLTDKKKKSNLQISKLWTGIEVALIGDILKKGVMQLLLLKNSSFSDWQDGCILTDIASFIPMDIGDQSSIPDECLKATISGLQKKIQDGKQLLAAREFEISQKIAATFDALYKLHDSTPINKNLDQRCVTSFQDSLVDIILHMDENSNNHNKIPLQKKPVVKLNRHWMKVINHHLMMCWTFSNQSERTICHPSLKIFIESQSVQCVQKLFVHDSTIVSFDDRSEKEVHSKTNFTIIVNLTNIPNFTERNIESHAVLSWYMGSSSELNNEILLPEEEKRLMQSQLPLVINLSTDIFNCVKQKDSFSHEDILLMKVLQQRIVLNVSSVYSDLADIEKYLCLDSEIVHIFLLKRVNLKCMIFKSRQMQLFGVHMTFKHINSKLVEIEAFTRNEDETFLLVQYLYQYLPADIIISPSTTTNDETLHLKKKIVYAMKEEIDLMATSLNIYNVSDHLKRDYTEVASFQAGTIIIPKETFCRIRKVLVKKEWITDNFVRQLISSNHYSET